MEILIPLVLLALLVILVAVLYLRFHRARIEGDEGFSVALGRDTIVYYEAGRRMAVTADVAAGQANIFTNSIGRWDDDLAHAVKAEERSRIADNIKRALERRGLVVFLM